MELPLQQPVSQAGEHDVEISVATKSTLVVLGVFFLALVLLLAIRILRALARPFRQASAKKTKPARAPAPHLQLRSTQATLASLGEQQAPGQSIKQLVKKSKQQPRGSQAVDAGSHHELYLNTPKGHGDVVNGLSWGPNAGSLATACDDRTIRVFDVGGNLVSSNIQFRRKNVTCGLVDVAFGQSASQLLVLTKGSLDAASLSMFTLGSGGFQLAWEIERAHGGGAALTVDGARNGVFATCGAKTDFKLFSSTGKELALLDSAGLNNNGIALSGNGKFIAAATFTSDVKVHEIVHDRSNGDFKSTRKCMDLKGHKRQVAAVAFSPDGTRAVTASHDHSLRVWKLDVRYQQQEDAKCLVNVQQQLPEKQCYQHLAFCANGIIAAGYERDVHFIASVSGDVIQRVEDAHMHIQYMQWSPQPRNIGGEQTYVLATAGDKRVRLWRSP